MTGKELDDQLKVYKKTVVLSSGQTFPAISRLNVAKKKELVIGLVQKYLQETSPHKATGTTTKI